MSLIAGFGFIRWRGARLRGLSLCGAWARLGWTQAKRSLHSGLRFKAVLPPSMSLLVFPFFQCHSCCCR